MQYIDQLTQDNLKGKRVLLRVDFNVAIFKDRIEENFRIKSHRDTINYLLDHGAKVALLAHISDIDSFEPIVGQISEVLGRELVFVDDCISADVQEALNNHDLVLLENVRQHKTEKENDDGFAKLLANGFDMYIGDAFATAHRNHASIVGVTKHLDSYAGLVIKQEVDQLSTALNAPQAGKTLVLGGAKISTKLPVIKNFVNKAEDILVGGALVNNFLKFQGHDIGKSLVDDDIDMLKEIQDVVVNLPRDFVTSKTPDGTTPTQVRFAQEVDGDAMILDIGPETSDHYTEIIARSKMVIWNGPMGMAEVPAFSKGTKAVAQAVAQADNAFIGGGDTIAAVDELGMLDKISHVSTGGGAMLTFLAGVKMPGLEALGYYD